MDILARLVGAVPSGERGGIRLAEAQPRSVSPVKDVERFLRALPLLGTIDAIVYFEGTGESHVARYLDGIAVDPPTQVAVGTIWPKPDRYHVPLTKEVLSALVSFLEGKPAGYFCTHCHVYCGEAVLLEWHDAFGTDPMYVSRTIENEALKRFAEALGARVD